MKTFFSSIFFVRMGFAACAMIFVLQAKAETSTPYTFPFLWKVVRQHAPEIEAANHDLEAAQIYERRMARHWYPKIVAEGRAYSTDDPSLTFMSKLGQRQIRAEDFAPDSLNHPDAGFFEHGRLGLDFPIYEGGAKAALGASSAKVREAKQLEKKAVEAASYANLAKTYAALLSLQKQRQDLEGLAKGVQEILIKYKIGARSNPVGYSGLLGLKNLRNRVEGLLAENSALSAGYRERVRLAAESLPAGWQPAAQNVRTFIANYLSVKRSVSAEEPPPNVRAAHAGAEALASAREAEKSRYRPKFGLFANEDFYNGSRGSATGYSAGGYLQWELLSATDYGTPLQARHVAAAAEARAASLDERVRGDRFSSNLQVQALDQNLALMENSAALLEEQTATAHELFRSGSINALQLVEVLARRADLLVSRADSERALAEAQAILFLSSADDGVVYED